MATANHRVPFGAPVTSTSVTTHATTTANSTHAISITAASLAEYLSLSGRARDQVTELLHSYRANIALERFISPEYADETHASLQHSRDELGALVNAINDKVLQKIHALADSLTLLHAQLSIDSARAS